MTKATNAELIAEKNKKLIIDTLKASGPLSRAEISRMVGLSFPAVSSNVSFLISEGYISEIGEGNNALGRKSTLLEFNAKREYVLGIDLGRYKINLAVADLLGNTEFFLSEEIREQGSIMACLRDILDRGLAQSPIDKGRIRSVCVGTPGVVSGGEDKILLVPFAETLSKSGIIREIRRGFDCPVTIENSVNLGAVGEKWKGCGSAYRNIVYINYGVGIGSALIFDGRLYTGANGIAGEIGFMAVSPDSLAQQHQDFGSLEERISGHSLDDRIAQSDLGLPSLKALFSSAAPEARALQEQILHTIGQIFGVALLNIASVVNPQAIILSGGIGIHIGALLVSEWETMLRENLPFAPEILVSEIDSRANVYGAIRYALKNIEDLYCTLDL